MNESESNFDYNVRQLSLMEDQLIQFESGKLKLPHLIAGLKSLQNCLLEVDENWKKEFTGQWWTLEQVYAVALDRKEMLLSQKNQNLIKEALDNLKKLIANKKGDFNKTGT